jgi:hypothetical protein
MPDEQLVRLIAPPGTDGCSFGTTRYPVGDDGTVIVPMTVAQDLMHGAGFALAPEQPMPSEQPDETADEMAIAGAFGDPEV